MEIQTTQAVDVITEAEWLYYNKGADIMWFIDSLVNGNTNELRAFALALRAKKIQCVGQVMHVVTDVWTKNTFETSWRRWMYYV